MTGKPRTVSRSLREELADEIERGLVAEWRGGRWRAAAESLLDEAAGSTAAELRARVARLRFAAAVFTVVL